ncbi:MAG: ATP-dependent zinc metalloprotease FtsH [Firmicutes bacterium]|nr:ATP-dependent zinc metalloprotease FtsH [Bacillota bacterium]
MLIYVLIFIVVAGIITIIGGGSLFGGGDARSIEFSELVDYLEKGQVTEILINENNRGYTAKLKSGETVIAYAPTVFEMQTISEKYIVPQSTSGSLVVKSVKPSNYSSFISWIPTLIMIIFMVILLRNMMGGGGNAGVMNFGKSKARMVKGDDKKRITFKDVAGLEEEKQELAEIVDFLKNPRKYLELGARIPKGVLLVGPPGTGKTYISKAVAGEAGVPFFSISGSDFVEMFVGVGASRVRDLFNDAKKNAPCIVFIDEIDAVGRRRGAGIGGGNDEREQTLNQLLVEMDGFDANEGIIVMAATNRPDVLDPAILRPGRFDRQVTISTPDVKGREEVFKLYAKNKPLDENVDLKVLAKRTPGFTPADIENMMNEAALLTARRNGTIIHMEDLEEAITRVIAGPQKRSRVMSEKERKLTAYHEAGHAVVMRATPGSDPVHQVTIMPRGSAGGFTMQLPDEDHYYITRTEMEQDIMHLLGGRIAESLVLGDISTGASSDLERATKTAHDMVTKYGMSKAIGPVNYSDADEVFLGRDFTSKQNYSEELASKIDQEVRSIIDKAYADAEKMLKDHRDELDRVAGALLEMETLDADQFEAIYSGTRTVAELQEEDNARSKARKKVEDAEAEARAKKEAEEAAIIKEMEGVLPGGNQMKKPPMHTRVARIDKDGNISLVGEKPENKETKENEEKQEDKQGEEGGNK